MLGTLIFVGWRLSRRTLHISAAALSGIFWMEAWASWVWILVDIASVRHQHPPDAVLATGPQLAEAHTVTLDALL